MLFNVSYLTQLRRNTGIPTYHQCSGVVSAHQSQPLHCRRAGEHIPTSDRLQLRQLALLLQQSLSDCQFDSLFSAEMVFKLSATEAVTALHS